MPTDPTLRHLFDAPQPDTHIDVAAIVRRSRARRAPKLALTVGASALAVGGLLFGGVQLAGGVEQQVTAGVGAAEDSTLLAPEGMMSDSDDAVKRAAATELNKCGEPVAEMPPSDTGLVLLLDFPDADPGADLVLGTVTLLNVGTVPLGYSSPAEPTITLSRDGIVVWHSVGQSSEIVSQVDLDPGESIKYSTSFAPVVCTAADEVAGFGDDLPHATPGEYQLSAAVDLISFYGVELVTGGPQTVTIR